MVVWQLLSGFCLTHHPILCDCNIEEKGMLYIYPTTLQRDNRVKVCALLRARHKVSRVANLVGVSCTTVYAINKHMDDNEGVNRCAGSGRKTVVDRYSLRDAIPSGPTVSICQHARRFGVGAAIVRL